MGCTLLLVPLTGVEPVRYCYRGILSPLCLPIPPQRRIVRDELFHIILYFQKNVKTETLIDIFIIFCRFVNDVLHIREVGKNSSRGTPIERAHREIVVLALANSQLLFEIIK